MKTCEHDEYSDPACPQCESEAAASKAEARQERPRLKITPLCLIDNIKGAWGVWSCEVVLSDGTVCDGGVESDGHMVAPETLELEDE